MFCYGNCIYCPKLLNCTVIEKIFIHFGSCFYVAVCVTIFVFSGMVADDSAEQSGFIRELLTKIFGVGFTEFFIRKLAHMSEYAALGF